MDTIRITLETLYDILRNEKKREDLQKLEDTFFIDVVSYLKEKQALLENTQTSDDIFAAGEKEKVEYELRSIKRILKEIYEKREKKIIDIALNRSRTKSDLIDTGAMLREEKQFYEEVLQSLNIYRRGILAQLFLGNMPTVSGATQITPKPPSTFTQFETPAEEESTPEEPAEDVDLKKIRFIHPMPSFVWKDMKVYGPYDQGEEVDIFPEVAELLVRKGRAEEI